MSAPNPKPERRNKSQQAIKRVIIVNRFIQSDAGGIKPGEDALDLLDRTEYRRQNLPRTRNESPAAAHRFPALQGAFATRPFRHDSNCSEFSETSHGSNGSSSTVGTHGSSSGSSLSTSFMQSTAELRVQPFHQQYQANRPYVSDAKDPENTYFSGMHQRHVEPSFPTLDRSGRAMTGLSDSTAFSAPTDITSPDLEIDPSVPTLQQFRHHCPQLSDTGTTPSDAHITESPLGSPGVLSHGQLPSTLPPPVTRFHTTYFPVNHQFDSHIPLSAVSEAPSVVVPMSRENSSQGATTGKGNTEKSPYEHEETVSNTANRESSEPNSSATSSDPRSTPPPENDGKEDSDDTASEQDSESPSDDSRDSADPLQRDFLEDLLRPVKHHLFQRLMLYVANNRNLGISLPTASLFGCTGAVKTEHVDPLTSLPLMPKEYASVCSLATGPNEAPVSTDPGPSSRRANGKRPCMPEGSRPGRADMSSNRKRKARGTGSPTHDNDGNKSDDEDERRRAPKPRRSPSPHHVNQGRRIACPYFKRNPQGPPKADACFRNGFKDIAKLKEHLDRVHTCPIHCPRCFTLFDREEDVAAHLRVGGEQMCIQVQEQPHDNVFNADQGRKLKERMRGNSPEEKWKTIWHILFPLDQERAIQPPSPWWVDRDELLGLRFYADYQEFLRNDLPRRIGQRLAVLVNQILNFEPHRSRIDAAALECVEESYANFRNQEAGGSAAVSRQHEAIAPAATVPVPTASSSAGPSTISPNAAVALDAGSNSIDPSLTTLDVTLNHYFQPAPLQPPQNGSMPAFAMHGLPQAQPVDTSHAQRTAPMLITPVSTQLEEPDSAHDMMTTSYLAVGHDGSAAHTPGSQSPDNQWTNIGPNAEFDDYTSNFYAHFSG